MALLTDINALAQTPSSVLNFITGSDSSSGWSGVNATVSTSTTASQIPAFPIRSTSIAINVTTAAGYGATSFTVPQGVGELVGCSFYYETSDLTASNWTVQLWQGATQITLPNSALVPTTTGLPFNFSVTLTKGLTYNIRFVSAATGKQIYLNGVTVGTSIPVQGAAIGSQVSFSATLGGTGGNGSGMTFSANNSYYVREGEYATVFLDLTLSAVGVAPSGYLTFIVPGLTPSVTAGSMCVGNGRFTDASAGINYADCIVLADTTPRVYIALNNLTTTPSLQVSDVITVCYKMRVAEWASNGTVNLGPGAQVEYAYTTEAWTATGTTTGYGPQGQQMTGALAGNRQKTITWQYPIQQDDIIQVETSTDRVSWVPANCGQIGAAQIAVLTTIDSAGNLGSGVIWRSTATQTVVTFGVFANRANDDAPTNDWVADAYWRVRKAKPSSPVGFGLAGPTTAGLTRKGATSVYKASTAQSFTSGGNTQVNYATLVSDDGNRVTNPSTAWRFTSQVSGFLDVRGVMRLDRSSGSWSIGNQMELSVTKNGTVFADLAFNQYSGANATTAAQGLSGATMVPVAIGDYIEIVVFHNGGAGVTGGATSQAWVSVQEIPN